MSSLKEIKTRIASVRNTLKITSAMKMVASAKLHHAQQAITGMHPYEQTLHGMLTDLLSQCSLPISPSLKEGLEEAPPPQRVAIVAFSSNTSLCGSFNANAASQFGRVVANLREQGLQTADIDVYAVGRKMADAVRRLGFEPIGDYAHLADHPNYAEASALAEQLLVDFNDGKVGQVILVYNHYASNSHQPSMYENWLPLSLNGEGIGEEGESLKDNNSQSSSLNSPLSIVEPSPEEVLSALLPKVLLLKLYTVLLDANAAEHAARTVAMQIASDNADKLLGELTLEYNKSRQQKITAEILDLVGGLQR